MVALSVSDSGAGMDEDTLGRVFEPFFTTKSVGKGTGLGLSQVYGFASQSGGDVRIESAPGEGTIVTLLLPCSGAAGAGARRGRPRGRRSARRTGRILLVEDNDEVGAFAEDLLVELGHQVRARARPGEEALELAARRGVRRGVHRRGHARDERPRARRALGRCGPDLPVILTTGYSDEIARSGAGGRPVILKPYRLETLAAAIEQALKGE